MVAVRVLQNSVKTGSEVLPHGDTQRLNAMLPDIPLELYCPKTDTIIILSVVINTLFKQKIATLCRVLGLPIKLCNRILQI
jgi:hypothetical protein